LSQIENILKNNKISALFLSTAYYLLPVYHVLNKLGIKAPDDIQLLCFDNLESMNLAETLKIAYIKMPLYNMGIRAVEYLKQKIVLKEKAPVINETFAADLIIPG
jgi:DNA-binding LacI/PurR family transcriptional regulator